VGLGQPLHEVERHLGVDVAILQYCNKCS
jgi:hypothetical protein